MSNIAHEDTIAAVSTPAGEGGIAIVRLSGSEALKIADRMFRAKDGKKPSAFQTYTVHYGHIIEVPKDRVSRVKADVSKHGPRAEIVDEVLLTVMRAPKSYTKEDIVEINCHGGMQAAKRVLALAIKHGAELSPPGEFTKRAFLNGRIDLAQAEAVIDVVRAKTENSLKAAMSQLEGGLSRKIDGLRNRMLDMTAQVEASIDFPEEDIDIADNVKLVSEADAVISELKDLIDTYEEGQILRDGVLAIICGKPNVGKSSLMNLLLKRDRVIVSPIPGTTRDAIEEFINLRGVPIRLVDTAGIQDTDDVLERESVKKSRKYLESADLVILMLDKSTEIERSDLRLIKLVRGKKIVVVLNKADKPGKIDIKEVKRLLGGQDIVTISVYKKTNISALEDKISAAAWIGGCGGRESALVANIRHKELLDKTFANMISVKKGFRSKISPDIVALDLKEAVYNLGLITGRSISEDILDRIFEQFCIGK